MSYQSPLRVLSITPTRDGEVNPSRRLADKHSRLFCGKSLHEWAMIQLWSSRTITRKIIVCETEAHREKLADLAAKYGIELIVRHEEMLHPHNDSAAVVLVHCLLPIILLDYYSLMMTPFVNAPCRPPGFFDLLVDTYLKTAEAQGWEFSPRVPMLMGGWQSDAAVWQINEQGIAEQVRQFMGNKEPQILHSRGNHWVSATWWYLAHQLRWFAREDPSSFCPKMIEIQPWMDIHIDTQEDWEEAEFWFRKKILSQGEDCYERYRASWSK